MLTLPKKLIIVLAALLAVELLAIGVAYGLVVGPQKQRVVELDEQLVTKNKEFALASEDAQEATRQRVDGEYEALQNSLAQFAIRPEELTDMLAVIDALAEEAGLQNFTRKTKPVTVSASQSASSTISQSWIDVTFSGSFNQFATFVSLLEGNRPVVFVDRFKLVRSRSSDEHVVAMVLMVLVRDAAPDVAPVVVQE